MGAESIDDINWDLIKNKRKSDENRLALENHMKVIDIYNVKPFSETIQSIQEEIEQNLHKEEDDEEQRLFKKELKEKNMRNLIRVYNDFLNKKRKHS